MGSTNRTAGWQPATLTALALLAGVTGCANGLYPVAGQVVYDDGSPVTEGLVVGEATVDGKPVMAQGDVQSDGKFRWGTHRPGDGARPGKYRVMVIARALGDAEASKGVLPAIDRKYADPKTSGIDFEVKESANRFDITVTRPKRAKP
jgi:hypothetical protein